MQYVLGPVADFAEGSHRVVRAGHAEIGVFNVHGHLYALPNVCPHQFGPLCTGTVSGTTRCDAETRWRFAWVRQGEILTCPWHGWEFDILTGRNVARPSIKVRTYPVTVEDGQVVVTM